MRSMTGYGRGVASSDDVQIVVDIRTVNHKGLDVKVRLPRESAQHEQHIVRMVQASMQRGRVDVQCDAELRGAARATLDVEGLRTLVMAVRQVGAELAVLPGISEGDLLHASLQMRRAVPVVDESATLLLEAVAQALVAVEESRAREGAALQRLLEERLGAIVRLVDELRARTSDAPQRAADKLRARLRVLTAEGIAGGTAGGTAGGSAELDPVRLAQEAALLADRLDVTEELERLTVHVELGRVLLAAAEPSGRKLDFLCQELLREANTTGSKVQDASSTHRVVELKSEIERLREQAQNVE